MMKLKTTVDGRVISTRLHNYGRVRKRYGGWENYCEGYLDGNTDDIRYLAEKRPETLVLLDEQGNEFENLTELTWHEFQETYPGHAIVYVESHAVVNEE